MNSGDSEEALETTDTNRRRIAIGDGDRMIGMITSGGD
jgi:hypothetical protein